MDELSLKLKLLSGEPIEIDENVGKLKPLTFRDIISYGYTNYLMMLNVMILDIGDLVNMDSPEMVQFKDIGVNVFDVMVQMGGDEIITELKKALSLFFNDVVDVDTELHIISIGSDENTRVIDRENFDKVREVIKWQNGINKFGDEASPSEEDSEAVRQIKEKLKKGKDQVAKSKQEDGENELDIADIISAVSTKSNSLNKMSIFDLTVFQLYDEFKRLELIDQYHISIKSMLAGAKDVKLKHWSSKLDW